MQSWAASCGRIDFDEPATLWIFGTGSARPWCSEGLTLAQAVSEVLATDPELHPFLRVTSNRFREPLDFDHVRALHGHADFPRKDSPGSTAAPPRLRVVVEVQVVDRS